MRRMMLFVMALFLALPLCSYASSIGGAETQGKGKVGIGLDQEFVFDRDMKLKDGWWWELDSGDTGERAKTEIDSAYRTMVKASYGVLDNLDIYVKLGTADFKSTSNITTKYPDGSYDIDTIKTKGNNAFAYGFGAKGTYNLKNDWIIGCDAQYLRHTNNYKGVDTWTEYDANGNVTDPYSEDTFKGKVTFQEWHIAPYIAKKLGNFVPYLGVRYSDLRQNYKVVLEDEGSKMKFKADDNVGVFVGTDYKLGESWKINLEGRFIDETAMSLGATYKF